MNAILIVFYQYFTILSTINKEIILLLIIIVIIIIMTIMIIIMIIMIIIITIIIIIIIRVVAMKIIKIIWASLNAKTMNAFKSFVPAPNEED